MVVARGGEEGVLGIVWWGQSFSFSKMKSTGGWLHSTVNIPNTGTAHFKMVKVANFMLGVFYYNLNTTYIRYGLRIQIPALPLAGCVTLGK